MVTEGRGGGGGSITLLPLYFIFKKYLKFY